MVKKTKITVFQALTLLIEKYRTVESAKEHYALISSIYLSGAPDAKSRTTLTHLLQDEAMQDFEVSEDWNDINDDPVRRYFESTLCHETLAETLDQLDIVPLTQHFNSIFVRLDSATQEFCENYVFQGLRDESIPLAILDNLEPTEIEYTENFRILKDANSFPHLKPATNTQGKTPETVWQERKEKMLLLGKCSFAAIRISEENLPINLYEQEGSIYDNYNRGRIPRQDEQGNKNRHVRPYNLGIMRAYMHVPVDDPLLAQEASKYSRPVDCYTFRKEALMPQVLFETLVTPFVTSISGTMLGQLKICAKLMREGKYAYANAPESQLKLFFKSFVAYMIYHSGGHSLDEFLIGLTLPEIREEFAAIPGFASLTLDHLFKEENHIAFERSITRVIKYNQKILNTKKIHEELLAEAQETSQEQTTDPLVQHARKRLKTASTPIKSILEDFYSAHAEFLRQSIHTIQAELSEYQQFSFWTLLLLIKDFFIGSTLTKDRQALAKSYSATLQEQSKQIETIQDREGLKQFSLNVTALHKTNVEANLQLEHAPQATGRLAKRLNLIDQEINKIANRSCFFKSTNAPDAITDAHLLESTCSNSKP